MLSSERVRSSLKVLHVASFSGNIGDNANHMGFQPWLEEQIGTKIRWTRLEIREFYWGERVWDASFVQLANEHDLLVIGGGNYFELWVESSPTGTSIAIEPTIFDQITVPVLFNALGVDPGQGVPETSLKRFRAFLGQLLTNPRCLVTVRNDGALDNLQKFLGAEIAGAVHRVPDGGFFCSAPAPASNGKDGTRTLVGINLASDMSEVRYALFDGSDPVDDFAREFASALNHIAHFRPNIDFVIVPHIFRDLEITSKVIGYLDDRLRRTRVSVAEYGSGDAAAIHALSIYAQCDLVLAMRFHANVCPIGLGRPTLGLACYPQILNLYGELNQIDRLVDVSKPGFSDSLILAVSQALDNPATFTGTALDAISLVTALRKSFEHSLNLWIDENELRQK